MTAPLTETTAARPHGQASEALKPYQEGMIAGTWGAATISLWFLILSDSRKTCMLLKIGGLSIPAFVNITPIKSTAYAF